MRQKGHNSNRSIKTSSAYHNQVYEDYEKLNTSKTKISLIR